MKKIIIAMMAAVSLLNFSGCDSLDMEPVSSISDANYWKSPDQFKAFNIGLHGLLRSQSSYNIFVLGEPRSDIYGDQPFGGEATQGVERFSYNTINAEFTGISNFANFYTTLNQINLMIRRTNETDLLGEAEKNYYLGQAYGLRAYIYFHLLRSWGDGNLKLQEKFTDVFSFNNKENSEMIFALHSGKEDDFMMWRDYNWRNNMVPQREYMAGYCDETGTPFLEIPGYNLQGLMRYQVKKDHYLKSFREGDTRLKGTLKAVYKKHEDGTLEYIAPIQYKFQGTTLEGSNERSWYDDYPIYRYADALLLLAEAKALLGEDPSTEINAVRERAYGSEYFNAHKNEVAYPNDKGSFYNDNPFEAGDENVMEAILKERLREFFFEGKRWYDLRRFGKDYVLKYTTAQESRLLWPINEGALTNNPALKQTPGY